MLHKIETLREQCGMDNPINASIVSLLTISLRKLAKQFDDGEDFAGDDGERLLDDLFIAVDGLEVALKNYWREMESN